MAIYSLQQISKIILTNPNKALIQKGRDMADKLMLHLHGKGMETAIEQCKHFENEAIYNARKKYAVSNKDLFSRLLQQEDMVFTAKGGSSYFNLPEGSEKRMNEELSNVRYGFSLRKWIKSFALEAYRADPMGVLFVEIEQSGVNEYGELTLPKAYPTYKSSYSIYDYLPTGRRLEHICFRLTVKEAISFGIQDPDFKDRENTDQLTDYYRFCDDEKDIIVKNMGGTAVIATNTTQPNPIKNPFGRTPAFIVSDLMRFDDPQCFVSPLHNVIELADTFLYDRSIRDLQKKYHGFAKAVEPMFDCATCNGTGMVGTTACPDCTVAGATKGTGYKLRTAIGDVAKFPLDILKDTAFDFKRIFGYVTPDIQSWEKQDLSLTDLESLIYITYWGTANELQQQQQKQQGEQKTATEVSSNNKPKEARLNQTADWAEKTENMLADFMGRYLFENTWKRSSISYGRNYILETPDELMKKYQEMRTKGAPDFALDEALEKYYHAMYQNNPALYAKYIKLLKVEPFPHLNISQAKGIITDFTDFNCKLYFGEWYSTLSDGQILSMEAQSLRDALKAYVMAKGIKEPAPDKTAILN